MFARASTGTYKIKANIFGLWVPTRSGKGYGHTMRRCREILGAFRRPQNINWLMQPFNDGSATLNLVDCRILGSGSQHMLQPSSTQPPPPERFRIFFFFHFFLDSRGVCTSRIPHYDPLTHVPTLAQPILRCHFQFGRCKDRI
jgi:hypothetical protein